jgi:hypothetical protein
LCFAPVAQLQADPNLRGKYTTADPNGFAEQGEYRVVFYARDKADGYAAPRLVVPGAGPAETVYLPVALR